MCWTTPWVFYPTLNASMVCLSFAVVYNTFYLVHFGDFGLLTRCQALTVLHCCCLFVMLGSFLNLDVWAFGWTKKSDLQLPRPARPHEFDGGTAGPGLRLHYRFCAKPAWQGDLHRFAPLAFLHLLSELSGREPGVISRDKLDTGPPSNGKILGRDDFESLRVALRVSSCKNLSEELTD